MQNIHNQNNYNSRDGPRLIVKWAKIKAQMNSGFGIQIFSRNVTEQNTQIIYEVLLL